MIVIYRTINICWVLVWHHFVQKEICYSLKSLIKDVSPYLLIALGAIVATYFCLADCTNIYLRFVGKIGMVALLYPLTMWASGSKTFKESLDYLLKRKKA